jgi:hypothetical protein
LTESEFSC